MTQAELARHWGGRTHAAVSDIERGMTRLTASGLAELAQILGKPVTFFYGQKASVQYLRGGREEDGTISARPGAEDFRKFLLEKKRERERE